MLKNYYLLQDEMRRARAQVYVARYAWKKGGSRYAYFQAMLALMETYDALSQHPAVGKVWQSRYDRCAQRWTHRADALLEYGLELPIRLTGRYSRR